MNKLSANHNRAVKKYVAFPIGTIMSIQVVFHKPMHIFKIGDTNNEQVVGAFIDL